MSAVPDDIAADFIVEAQEILDRLGEQLVSLEQAPQDSEQLNAVFRGFHTLKGGAGFLGTFSGAFGFDVADGQPQQLHHGSVVGEEAAVLDDLAELVVQRLDAVGGVDHLPQGGPE